MRNIEVVFKSPSPTRGSQETVQLTPQSTLPLKKLFFFEEKFAAFSKANEGKLKASNLQQAFYNSLTKEEQLLDRAYIVSVEKETDVPKILEALRKLPTVQSAQVETVYEPSLLPPPNDPLYNSLWGMPKIKADQAWTISTGSGIVVAVCDTGIDQRHLDIAGNLWNDGFGNFGPGAPLNSPVSNDNQGHGTHVAGTIGAIGGNGIGVIGVAPKVKIMSVRIFPNPSIQTIVNALMYAANNGARLINCSWGPATPDPVPLNPIFQAGIDYAYNKGCYCIFAAGNYNIDCTTQFPANYSKVITVSSTTPADGKSGFSNWGAAVDIAAPGENILSLKRNVPGQPANGYVNMSGTSMAAPHVTGAAALILSLAPRLSFTNLRYFLQKSADPISTTPTISGLRLNCYKLVAPAVQTYKRQTNVDTTNGRYALHTSGKIAHLNWTPGGWVQNLIPVWGPPVLAGSMIDMGGGRVAGVNAVGSVVNTYGGTILIPNYAPIHETFGIVAGTLRFSSVRSAFFALNVFNDFVFIKWVNNQWNMDVIPCYAGATVASSVELTVNSDDIMATNIVGVMGHTWANPNGQVLSDGTKITFNQITVSSNLIP